MLVRNVIKIPVLLIILGFLGGCAPMDSLFPSIGNYKVNVLINNLPLDECSFAKSGDIIRPFFEESVFNDPDITGLEVFLRNSMGSIVGWEVFYELTQVQQDENSEDTGNSEINNDIDIDSLTNDEQVSEINDDLQSEESSNQDPSNQDLSNQDLSNQDLSNQGSTNQADIIIPANLNLRDLNSSSASLSVQVKNLDYLPSFPLPSDLRMGRYTIVFHIMSGNNILQRIEKPFFYLSETDFNFKSINVNLPGIAESTQLIPTGTVIMLEANVDYDSNLDPYIEWYSGRRKISEGKLSDGAGYLFWKAPEESGFFSFRAVVLPVDGYKDLSGFQKDVSLLVTSTPIDIHLVSESNLKQGMELVHWYILEANLLDSKMTSSAERSLRHEKNTPKWRAANGTYGVSTGFDNNIFLPRVSFSHNDSNDWQIMVRFKPVNNGGILSAQIDRNKNIYMHLYIDGPHLILTLTSPLVTVSQVYTLLTPNTASMSGFTGRLANTTSEDNITFLSDINELDFTGFDNINIAEQIWFEELLFDQLSLDQTPFEQATLEQMTFEQMTLEQATLDQTAFDQTTFEQTAFVQTESEEIFPFPGNVVQRTWVNEDSFITATINLSVQSGFLSAQLNVLGDFNDKKQAADPISLEVEDISGFQVFLGFLRENNKPADVYVNNPIDESSDQSVTVRHELTALWDEIALIKIEPTENQVIDEQPETESDEIPSEE